MTKLTTNLLCEIRDKADAELGLKAAIADGMVVLREAAVRKMLIGETTFDDMITVTGEKK